MVNALLIIGHPDPRSLNHAAAEHIIEAFSEEGHTVHVHDLYAEHFEPVLENEEIQRRFSFDAIFAQHSRELTDADGIVIVYPDWWGMPPAILKGWLDRIFRPGIVFDHTGPDFGSKETSPLLTGKRAMVVCTTDETNPLSQEAMFALWRERIFAYVGITNVTFKAFYGVRASNGAERRRWLEELGELARRWL